MRSWNVQILASYTVTRAASLLRIWLTDTIVVFMEVFKDLVGGTTITDGFCYLQMCGFVVSGM